MVDVYPCTSRQKEKSRATSEKEQKRGRETHDGPPDRARRERSTVHFAIPRARSNPAHAQPRVPRPPSAHPTPRPRALPKVRSPPPSPPRRSPLPLPLVSSRAASLGAATPITSPPFPYPRSLALLPQIPHAWMDSVGTNRTPLRSAAAAAPATRSSALPWPHCHPAVGNR